MLDRPASPPPHPGRTVRAEIAFVFGGGRTVLARQSVPYPLHATRPHHLDASRPALATLVLQSASGGLFGGDRLTLSIAARAGAMAHVTSQAATVVHATPGEAAVLDTRVAACDGAVLAVTTDPYILFPASGLSVCTDVALAPGATVILAEGFAVHDPAGTDRPFARLSTRCLVAGQEGTMMVDEGANIDGATLLGAQSPLGPYRAFGSVMVLGEAAWRLDPAAAEGRLEALGVLAGASLLPGGAGFGLRLLAREGGTLARGLDAAVAACFKAALGTEPARRRP